MSRRQGRAVVLVNAGISVAIVSVIAGVSVFRHPASPPTITEFAPANPGRQITDAPSAQPAQHGATDRPVGPLARPRTAGVPSALQCWAWPDGSTTQTFDRQSPPCISSWDVDAGNGGTTSPGVTRTEVRVGVPAASVSAWQPYATWFSRHYQLYGRTLRLVPLGLLDFSTAEGQRAAAASAAEHGVFAALQAPTDAANELPDLGVYLDTLANERVVGVLTGTTQVSTTALSAQAPYAWTHTPAMDTLQRTLAGAVCRELSGGHARFSSQMKTQNRRFVVLVPASSANSGASFDASALTDGLERCHVAAPVRTYEPSNRGSLDALFATARREGFTTVIPMGTAGVVATSLMPAAQRVGYQPEWLLAGLGQQRVPEIWSRAIPEQTRALFGLATWSPPLPESRLPAVQALRQVSPGASFGTTDQAVYDGLSLIAAGIQLAGARLTAESFGAGLETTSFANPGAGGVPDHQARVGFQDVDHTMVDDLAQVWWRKDAFCFVGNGRRWTVEELPFADPGFFNADKGC